METKPRSGGARVTVEGTGLVCELHDRIHVLSVARCPMVSTTPREIRPHSSELNTAAGSQGLDSWPGDRTRLPHRHLSLSSLD